MCGITGFIDFTNQSTRQTASKMADTMAHRGPDGQQEFFEQANDFQIGLGHRRLSVIDLSQEAAQPMFYDKWVIVYNGEIYNFREIKGELISLGHVFTTHSDTEVILHSWQEWGKSAIKKWHGMFAIALYNKHTNELTIIRDRAGVKPLYYYYDDGLFLFGSELKTLMGHPGFKKAINPDAIASFLQYGYVPGPYAIFNHTHKLQPGYLLQFDLASQTIITEQYWNVYDYYNKPKLKISLPDAISETERILERAFQYRMVSDVPVGVFLSGGYDSTCVTALLQKNSTEKLKTFTIGMTDGKLNEAPFAKEIANKLGTNHTEQYCTIDEALEILPTLPDYYDEPFADPSAIPTILVSRLARQQVTVALSADAGDEIFAGYNRYDYIQRYQKKIAAIPSPLRKILVSSMSVLSSGQIPFMRNKVNFHHRYTKLKNLLKDPSTRYLLKNLNLVFSDTEITRTLSQQFTFLKTRHQSSELLYNDPLDFMMAIDYQTYMVDDILQKVDRATMSVSLEGREPFLDQYIIEWAAQLPSHYKYHKGIKKYILRDIVHQYIPKEMMDRPKMGFGIPVADWLLNELRPLVEEYFSERNMNKHNLFNYSEVQKLKDCFYGGRKEEYLKIWHLLMFQMWYKRWMIG